MNRYLLLGLVAGFMVVTPSAFGQNLVSRASDLNYNYVYGAGGDTHVGGDQVLDNVLVSSDMEHLDFHGDTSGVLPGNQPYSGSVDVANDLAYQVTGSLSNFQSISAQGFLTVTQ